MNFAPLAHVINGPLDAIIEVVAPLAVVGAMWWWSTRAERRAKRAKKKDGPK